MTPNEFNALVSKEVSDREMNIIQTVYTFHPAIQEIGGKEQIAKLYLDCGMTVIQDMLPRAEKLMMLEQMLFKAQAEVDRIKNEVAEVSRFNI